jgi:hypothetical protein
MLLHSLTPVLRVCDNPGIAHCANTLILTNLGQRNEAGMRFKSLAAREAQKRNYGDKSYWRYLDNAAKRMHKYYQKQGDKKKAKSMFTRSLSEALLGNEGE